MKDYRTEKDLRDALSGILELSDDKIKILDENKLRKELIDELVWNLVFSANEIVRNSVGFIIRLVAKNFGLIPATIYDLYKARGNGEFGNLTVPAINIRGLTYDVARSIFRAAKRSNTALIIFEIARSEIGYTNQPPSEYTNVILGAGIKENYCGPIFLQGDHFQVNAKKFIENPDKELQAVKDLIQKSVDAGFYSIDLDTSTLVDLSKSTVKEQQRRNFEVAASITKFVREIEPKEITVALGGEIGEIGGKNSTEEELRSYMDGYLETIGTMKGITKVAVQTGTTHGGIPLPDGTIAKVKLDFDTLEKLGKIAQQEYKLAGCVQHGASTLPPELFDKFPKTQTAEIHLATEYQNMIYDSPLFPEGLKKEINNWLFENCISEKKETDTDQQFLYKTRKKAFGPFKKELWSLNESIRQQISAELESKFAFLFNKLNVENTTELVKKYTKIVDIPIKIPSKELIEVFEGSD